MSETDTLSRQFKNPSIHFQIVDSNVLPMMLCYSCIVQLNMAYNFKNIVVETHLYLDRYAIENGLNINDGGTMTPAASSIIDEDQDEASVISSIRDERPARIDQTEMPPPPPLALAGTSTRESTSHKESSQNNVSMNSSSTTTDDLRLLEEGQIKTEPWDETDDETILRTAMAEARKERNLGSIEKRKSDPRTEAATTPKKIRLLNHNYHNDESPSKRPMVAVPREMRNSKQDKEYLEKILRKRVAKENKRRLRRRKNKSSGEEDSDTESEDGYKDRPADNSLTYDLNNSTFMKELLSSLPKQRLRVRRSSVTTTSTT